MSSNQLLSPVASSSVTAYSATFGSASDVDDNYITTKAKQVNEIFDEIFFNCCHYTADAIDRGQRCVEDSGFIRFDVMSEGRKVEDAFLIDPVNFNEVADERQKSALAKFKEFPSGERRKEVNQACQKNLQKIIDRCLQISTNVKYIVENLKGGGANVSGLFTSLAMHVQLNDHRL